MRLLAIESATDMVGVALLGDEGQSAERIHAGGRAHAELLVPAIEEVCAVSACTVADVDAIAVDVGPGLFTGLRVGVATAKALGQALAIDLVGVSSLDILAAAALDRAEPGVRRPVVSVVDARRGEVFTAAYRFDQWPEAPGGPVDPDAVRHDRAAPMAPEALVAWILELAAKAGPVTVVGDGAERYRPLLSEHAGIDLRRTGDLTAPPPLALGGLARGRLLRGDHPVPPAELAPDYRRAADARINWEQRAPRSDPAAPSPGGGGPPR